MTDRFDPFWAGCANNVLLVTRCSACARWHWYPPLACPCGTGSLVWTDVGRTGTVFSFTVAHRSFLPPGAVDLPFPVALVEPDAAPGVRLLGPVISATPAVGQRVSVDFRDGIPIFLNS